VDHMGLFDFIRKPLEQDNFLQNSNIDLAEKLFATLLLSNRNASEKEKREIEKILKQCPTRQDLLNKVIELCGTPITPRQRYLIAKAYAWSKAEYRKQAIVHIEHYLNNPLYEGAYTGHHHMHGNRMFTLDEEKNIHLADMYSYLGKAYEGEYEFNKALVCYKKEQELVPFWAAPYCRIASVLIKQNMLCCLFLFY
jgi:tetratricopeptide (TPR) repeat protein